MSEDIPALIARIRTVQSDGYLSATYLGNEHVGDLLREILDAMKVEHEQAERYRELTRRTELQCQDAEAEAEKWQKLWEKAANGVLSLQAERDALRAQIEGHGGWDEWISEHVKVSEENDALRAKLDEIQSHHTPKRGSSPRYAADDYQAEREPVGWEDYTICNYDHTDWPCMTQCILSRAIDTKEQSNDQ